MTTTYIRTQEEAEIASDAANEQGIYTPASEFLQRYLMNVRPWAIWGERDELAAIDEAIMDYRQEQDEAGLIWSDEDDCYYDPSDPDSWPQSVISWHENENARSERIAAGTWYDDDSND